METSVWQPRGIKSEYVSHVQGIGGGEELRVVGRLDSTLPLCPLYLKVLVDLYCARSKEVLGLRKSKLGVMKRLLELLI